MPEFEYSPQVIGFNDSTYDDERLTNALYAIDASRLQLSNEDLEAIISIAGKYA